MKRISILKSSSMCMKYFSLNVKHTITNQVTSTF